MPRRWRAGVPSSLWGVSPSLISLVKRWVGGWVVGRVFFKARGCSGGWLVCSCIVLFLLSTLWLRTVWRSWEASEEMDLGPSAASGIAVPVGLECQQEGRGIWLFSLWGRQDQPLRVLPLWNTLTTPGRNPQTASSGNQDINHAMLLINCFRLRFYS